MLIIRQCRRFFFSCAAFFTIFDGHEDVIYLTKNKRKRNKHEQFMTNTCIHYAFNDSNHKYNLKPLKTLDTVCVTHVTFGFILDGLFYFSNHNWMSWDDRWHRVYSWTFFFFMTKCCQMAFTYVRPFVTSTRLKIDYSLIWFQLYDDIIFVVPLLSSFALFGTTTLLRTKNTPPENICWIWKYSDNINCVTHLNVELVDIYLWRFIYSDLLFMIREELQKLKDLIQ